MRGTGLAANTGSTANAFLAYVVLTRCPMLKVDCRLPKRLSGNAKADDGGERLMV